MGATDLGWPFLFVFGFMGVLAWQVEREASWKEERALEVVRQRTDQPLRSGDLGTYLLHPDAEENGTPHQQ
jgi:hypothetical protein